MAVYRCEVKTLRRAAGRSAVAASAYRSAECLRDQRSGKLFDYRRRAPGIAYRDMMSRKDVPEWSHRRDSLWNAAERAEKRCNSVTAREIIVSLPHELNDTQRIELVRDFAGQLVDRYGVAVDVCIHRPDRKGDQRNHHAHLLMTTRRLGPDGFEKKTRELDENKGRGPGEIEAIRQLWERGQNHALEQAGSMERVSRLSNAAQGLDREPQPKLGKAAVALMRRGEPSSRVNLLKEVEKRNAARVRKNETEHAGHSPHSPMRQNMAKQAERKRSAKVEAEKQEAIKRALDAARMQEPAQSAFDAVAKNATMPLGKPDAPPEPIPRPSAGFNAPAQAKAGKQEALQRALQAAQERALSDAQDAAKRQQKQDEYGRRQAQKINSSVHGQSASSSESNAHEAAAKATKTDGHRQYEDERQPASPNFNQAANKQGITQPKENISAAEPHFDEPKRRKKSKLQFYEDTTQEQQQRIKTPCMSGGLNFNEAKRRAPKL